MAFPLRQASSTLWALAAPAPSVTLPYLAFSFNSSPETVLRTSFVSRSRLRLQYALRLHIWIKTTIHPLYPGNKSGKKQHKSVIGEDGVGFALDRQLRRIPGVSGRRRRRSEKCSGVGSRRRTRPLLANSCDIVDS